MRLVVTALVMLVFLPLPARAGRAAASPTDVLLARNRTEPVVAVDPQHPNIVVAGSNTNYSAPIGGAFPTAYFASTDGGRSFIRGNVPLSRPYTTGADPSIAIAGDGTVFFSYLAETPSVCTEGGGAAVTVTHSIDHGRSFRAPVVVDANAVDDKPNLAVESLPGRPSHLFAVWTRWHSHSSAIWLSRSLNGGATFSRPTMLHSSRLDNYGAVPVVGPGGHIYVFWSLFPDTGSGRVVRTRVVMRASADDGSSFLPMRTVSTFPAVPRITQPGSLRNLTMPAATADRHGHVFVAWSQATNRTGSGVDADIKIVRSTDQGRTWSHSTRVNDVRAGDRFMPAVAPFSDGSVGIAFYDRRRTLAGLDVYGALISYRGGAHVARNVRLNQRSSPISDIFYIRPGSTCFSPGRFFGDYIGVAASPHHTLSAVWADTQLHIYNETDLWFARLCL